MDLRGRYPRACVKQVVERCLRLHAGSLRDALAVGGPVDGRLAWNASGGGAGASLEFAVSPLGDDRAELRLQYSLGAAKDAQAVEEAIIMVATPQPFGGRRWAFLCPLERDGRACGRRAWVLYLPPGQVYFGCRQCYDLSYMSRQQRRDPMQAQDSSVDPPEPQGTAMALSGGSLAACQPGQVVEEGTT